MGHPGFARGERAHVTKRRGRGCALALCAALFACTTTPTFPPAAPSAGKRPPPVERDFRSLDLAKADIDLVAEVHSWECLGSARLVMEKLYRRTPREWR